LDGTVKRDDRGYIFTCRELSPRYDLVGDLSPRRDRSPFPLETSLPGVFAVGDVRHNSVKRVAAAVGAGATAIASVHAYLAEEVAQEQVRAIPLRGGPPRPRPPERVLASGRLTP
jgi:thioredoxin reductase (NADPH)